MEEQQTTGHAPEHDGRPPTPEVARSSRPRFPRLRRFVVPLILLVVMAAAAFLLWKLFFAKRGAPASIVILSGRIEGDDSAVAPKTTGRILEIRFREGDSVKAGETIAILDDQQVRAREEQANAALLQALARSRAATDQINVLQEQLRQGEAEVAQ